MRTMDLPATKFGRGQAVVRVEDERFITGKGRYTDDLAPEGTLRGYVLRAPHAHARFTLAGVDEARRMPGVHLILTGEDTADLGSIPCAGISRLPGAEGLTAPHYPALATDTVRHVGDAVAFVVADTLWQAKDAAEAIMVDYEPLPAVIGIAGAQAPGADLVWPERPGNVAFRTELGAAGPVAEAFAKAHRVIELTVVNQRLVTNYMEGRAVLAEHDAATGRTTLTLGSQGVHTVRDSLAKSVFRRDPKMLRVISPDVGGGFGTKTFPYREYPLAAVAAEKLNRPVAWTQERTEHFLSCAHGRDNLTTLRLALDAENRFLGLDVELLADMGAYLSYFAPFIPWLGATMTPGVYAIPACHVRITGLFTHTLPVDAYRGAGRPEATYALERLVDFAALELGVAPDELRRLNAIPESAMPYKTALARTYDTGDVAGHLAHAKSVYGWDDFAAREQASADRGLLRGRGLATYIEVCGGGAPETAVVDMAADGRVTVLIGHQSTGQGHETAYAQIVASFLDVPVDQVTVVQGDTDRIATGTGTGGSRSIPVGGSSVAGASKKLADVLKAKAADELEAGVGDLEITGGMVRVAGTDRAIGLAALASKAAPGELRQTDAFRPPEGTYPNGTHICEVEIDPETGVVTVASYGVVDDFGVTLNPLMLAGQVHGGIVQGIGQAILENTVYDATGQLLTASFMDYAMPRAADVPHIGFETRNIPSTTNAIGVKGAGEAGTIGACPAVMNAVVDALWRHYGIRHLDMPATPERVWQAIEAARRPRRM